MTFELKTDEEGNEYIEEITTHTHQTRKLWTVQELEAKIAEFDSTLERRAVLEEQLKRFKK